MLDRDLPEVEALNEGPVEAFRHEGWNEVLLYSVLHVLQAHLAQCQEEERKVYAVRRHFGSLCTQKQPKTAALKAAIRTSDLVGGQPLHSVNSNGKMHPHRWHMLASGNSPEWAATSTRTEGLWHIRKCIASSQELMHHAPHHVKGDQSARAAKAG